MTLPAPLDPTAVEFGRTMGRIAAEQEAREVIARLVMAAGGEIRVPDRLLVGDRGELLVSDDPLNAERVYRCRWQAHGERGL